LTERERYEVDYDAITIKDAATLATELSKKTGFKFFIAND